MVLSADLYEIKQTKLTNKSEQPCLTFSSYLSYYDTHIKIIKEYITATFVIPIIIQHLNYKHFKTMVNLLSL